MVGTLDGLLEEASRGLGANAIATSHAISAKRTADALERIAAILEGEPSPKPYLGLVEAITEFVERGR